MRVAVNTRFLLSGRLEGIGTFTHEVLKRLVKWYPEHEFIFIFDRPWHSEFCYGENVIPVEAFPQARHPFLFYWWFEWSVPRILKKYKADVFFSPDGYLSLRSDTPQVPVFHDLAFEHYPDNVPFLASKHYRYFFPKYGAKADKLLTVSEFSKADIISQYQVDSEKIEVVYNGANECYRPLDEGEIIATRKKYAQGNAYFLYVGALHQRKNIVRLLKAYDQYLHWAIDAKEPIKELLIVGRKAWGNQEMESYFDANLILQQHVVFTGRLELTDLAMVMGAAYVHVNVSYFEGFGIPILESMKCDIPAITSQNTSMEEVGGAAVRLVDPFKVESIAEALTFLHSQPEERNRLASLCRSESERFSWDLTAKKVWKQIEEVATNKKQ